jgi:peptide subunit release factor 1 (eRF1)/intein/homing endonuclease
LNISDTSKKFDSVSIYRIRKLLSDLSNKVGRGTELVTLYVPPKKPIHEAIAALREEQGTASNIKSDTTRAHVQDALTKTIQRLRLYKQTPENGLVIFCGAIPGPGGPGKETIELFEILPSKPVTVFTYRCVSPDSKILLTNGMHKTIGELKLSWRNEAVRSSQDNGRKVGEAGVRDYLETFAGDRRVYRLTSESGRALIATEDHPFFTPTGWKNLAAIKPGDLVCVYPCDDMDSSNPNFSDGCHDKDRILIDEQSIRRLPFPPANIELTIRRLKHRGLLPLTRSNPKLPLIARVMGHIFGDGSFTHNIETRNGKPYSHFTFDICVGDKDSEEAVRADLISLGSKVAKAFPTTRILNVEGRSYTTKTIHIKFRDTAFFAMLRALGAPIGSKVKNGTKIPKWLFEAPALVQREFLAGYMGGDGEAPRMTRSNPISAIRITFHRAESLRDQAFRFAQDISTLWSNFGVKINAITSQPGYVKKDGTKTLEFELRFALTEENVLRICHAVGYRYSERKASASSLVGEYLRVKSFLRAEAQTKMLTARQMRYNGSTVLEMASSLDIPETKAKSWTSGGVVKPLVSSTMIPEFSEWLSVSRVHSDQLLLWENVVSIEPVELQDVRDLTLDSEDHSFFANGFLVHNCDDHFHLDPLRDMLKDENVIGMLSIDATEAGLGVISGQNWEVIDVITSGVSGKTRKGGQCVSSDTLVQLENGQLVKISSILPNVKIASYNFVDYTSGSYKVADTFSVVPKEYYVVETRAPKMRVLATPEHRFFTLASEGVSTVQAFNLKPGDRVIVSRKLPPPKEPSLATRFPAEYRYHVSREGREVLKKLRSVNRKLSQTALARILELHQTEISQLERGERDLSLGKLRKIIGFLSPRDTGFLENFVQINRTLPEQFTGELLQLLGYIAGDGTLDGNRIIMYEQRQDVAELYSRIARRSLYLDYVPVKSIDKTGKKGSFARHPYYEVRIYCKQFADALAELYPSLISEAREIPEQIHRLDNEHLKFFVRGLFDAEGYVRYRRIGIAMKSELLIRELQLLLLRFGIVSSYSSYRNRFGSTMHALDITDFESICEFSKNVGFSADDKSERLRQSLLAPPAQSYLDVPVLGSWIASRAKELGIRRKKFPGITNFFVDERGISLRVFKRIIGTFEGELVSARRSPSNGARISLLQDTASKLAMIERSGLILATVNRVELKRNIEQKKFYDIELPLTRSFIGNGLVLHNSARRYERLREMELTEYYSRVADHAKKAFLEQRNIRALIVSGPGPTKEEFVKNGYLDYRLQNAITGIIDSGYAGREGVREAIEKSGKLLENVRAIDESRLVQKFLKEVNTENGLAVYGINDVLAALKKAAVDVILVNDDVQILYLRATCARCGNVREKFIPRSQYVAEKQALMSAPCPNCQGTEIEIAEKDIVDYLADASLDSGARVEVISGSTESGTMLKSFTGIGALLRYRV